MLREETQKASAEAGAACMHRVGSAPVAAHLRIEIANLPPERIAIDAKQFGGLDLDAKRSG